MSERVYIAMTGEGDPIGYGTEAEASAAAVARSNQTGGVAFLESVPTEPQTPVRNPPLNVIKGALSAYESTGLMDICQARYGHPHLTLAMVESMSLQEAHALVRPYLPANKKYNKLRGVVGGGVLKVPPAGSKKKMRASYGMLATNAKLAKADSPDDRVSIAYGLVLAPHQVGLRGKGVVLKSGAGMTLGKGEQTKEVQEALFSGHADPSAAKYAAQYSGVHSPSLLAMGKRVTVCPHASIQCKETCLVHSGQNPASVEALTSKLGLTRALYAEPLAFCRLLLENLRRYFCEAGGKADVDLYIRLNVFSDIPWEQFFPDLLDPVVLAALRAPDGDEPSLYDPGDWESRPLAGSGSYYDYTKVAWRMHAFAAQMAVKYSFPIEDAFRYCNENYYLTLSYSGANEHLCKEWLAAGLKVAIVFVLERAEKVRGDWSRMGVPTVAIDDAAVKIRFGRIDDPLLFSLTKQLWKWSDDGLEPGTSTALGRMFKHYPPPPIRNPMPPHLIQQQRREFAAATLRKLGLKVTPDDRWVPLAPAKGKNLRGIGKQKPRTAKEGEAALTIAEQKGLFYDVEFPKGHPFAGYKVINADINDLRAKDDLIVDGPALVGLDFKVAKIRIEVDTWIAHEGTFDDENPHNKEFATLAAAKAYAASHPGFRVRQKGELHQERLDLAKNTFVTPVYKAGEVFFAVQIPRQTLDGEQE